MRIAINIAAFYAAWFGAAFAAARGELLAATLICLAAVALHVALSSNRTLELRLAAAAVMIGFVVESLLLVGGATRFTAHDPGLLFPPAWILALWAAFATLINVSLDWIKTRLPLAALFGALGAPPSYWGGEKIGAIAVGTPVEWNFLAIAVIWAIGFPLLVAFARRLERFSSPAV
jgi:hypothetical protein